MPNGPLDRDAAGVPTGARAGEARLRIVWAYTCPGNYAQAYSQATGLPAPGSVAAAAGEFLLDRADRGTSPTDVCAANLRKRASRIWTCCCRSID